MKQNLIIAGVPRAGKNTIANKISKKFGYQQICMDSIIAGFEQNFPELGINSEADEELYCKYYLKNDLINLCN